MRSLKSKETKEMISAILYKHDISKFRAMGAPKDEYLPEAIQILYRLRFKLFIRNDNKDQFALKGFTYKEILEEVCRTHDFFNENDGTVTPILAFNKESKSFTFLNYTPSKINPCNRNDEAYTFLTEDIYDYICGKEVSLDTTEVDEMRCNSLKNKIKYKMEESGFFWNEVDLDGEWSLDGKSELELNQIFLKINPTELS